MLLIAALPRMLSLSELSSLPAGAGAWVQGNRGTAALIGAAGGVVALGDLYSKAYGGRYRKSPSSFEISGGAVDASKVKDTVSGGIASQLPSAALSGAAKEAGSGG